MRASVSDGYSIRLANAQDLALLPHIEREAAGRFEPYGLAEVMGTVVGSAEDFRAACAAERLWVAADAQDHPVGFALAGVVGDCAHLDELDVLPQHGRRGLGAALVRAVHDWAIRQGFPAVTLTTLDNIPWNRPFYERLGYRVVDPADMPEPLRRLLTAEIARGLPGENRVAMRHNLLSAAA